MDEKNDVSGFMKAFLSDLREEVADCMVTTTGELENTLHQKMPQTGNKKKSAKQLNLADKVSNTYINQVEQIFQKNFDKFTLYLHRNLISIPDSHKEAVQQLYVASKRKLKERKRQSLSMGETYGNENDTSPGAILERQEKEKDTLEKELVALRKKARELKEATARLKLEEIAMIESTDKFQQKLEEMTFIKQMDRYSILSPLKRTAMDAERLTSSFQEMENMKAQLDEEARKFKRQKSVTRGEFRNLSRRFMTRSAAMAFVSTEDIQQLNTKLQYGQK